MFASRTAFFAVILDFGEENYEDEELIFGGDKRWLQIGVRPGADTGIFTPLAPRQELRATPYAFFATGAEEAEELEG
jgi:hypothetical protein